MAATNLTTIPEYTSFVDQAFFVAPLGGPKQPINYLDSFPEEVYNKAIDSHLVKFMYALLGPGGAGWLRKNYLQARLLFEDHGLDLFDLDGFYGNPLAFGRILEEVYDVDPTGLLPRDKWDEIRAKDARYRNRAVDFLHGARLGNTPEGMHLVARSGLGHEVEIIEHYKYLYDQLSDDPLGLPQYGQTNSTEEMVVLPRRVTSQSEMQTISITGSPTGGTFILGFAQYNTLALAFNASADDIRTALEGISIIGPGQVDVTGGPGPNIPWTVLFTGNLAARDVPQLSAFPSFTTAGATIFVTTDTGGADATDEIVSISERNLHYLQGALDRIRPVTTIPTVGQATGLQARQIWNQTIASSEYREVVRYVTGSVGIIWPARNNVRWIERGVEHESRRAHNDLQHHYYGLHNVISTIAYTDAALGDSNYGTDSWPDVQGQYLSEHVGAFGQPQRFLFSHLAEADAVKKQADMALADFPEPLTITSITESGQQMVNGIYPAEYQNLKGVPPVRYPGDQFWASRERPTGDEYIELDLGRVQALNYLSFEISRKAVEIDVAYDTLDLAPRRTFAPVTLIPERQSVTAVSFGVQEQNPWVPVEIHFTNPKGDIVYARFLRLRFARRNNPSSPFVNPGTGDVIPWSIEVRNLRVGRNVS